jgi:transcriptional regulator with XRE-family HTH domain
MNKTQLIQLGKKIQAARIDTKLTRKNLGKLLNVSESSVYRYEIGQINPSHRLEDISKILNKDINYFLDYIYPLPKFRPTRTVRTIPLISSLGKGLSKALFQATKTYECPDWLYKKHKNSLFALELRYIKSKDIVFDKNDIGIFVLNNNSKLKLVQTKRKWYIKKTNKGLAGLVRLERNFL